MIDSHCHLHYDYEKPLPQVILEAEAAGVTAFITVATDLNSIPLMAGLSEQATGQSPIYHSIGIHPHDTQALEPFQDQLPKSLEEAARHPSCCAIGEIGLDYHYNHSLPETQRKYLQLQLDWAKRLQLPVIIHSREAESDLFQALEEYARQIPYPPGVIHCFSGSLEFGRKCLNLGFYLSFSGILTFKSATALQEMAKEFPLDRLLLETDAPYLAPIPFRGKKCEPKMIQQTALKLAELRGLSLLEIDRQTTLNTQTCFQLLKD